MVYTVHQYMLYKNLKPRFNLLKIPATFALEGVRIYSILWISETINHGIF